MTVVLRIVRRGNVDGERELTVGESLVVGRSPEVDVRVLDLVASRKHCQLKLAGDGCVWIEDLGSRSGTIVNGTPLTSRTQVPIPCVVEVGRYQLQIHVKGEAPRVESKVWDEFFKEKLLGEGGYGKVYAARRIEDHWMVAIKEVELRDPDLRERFLREARLCEKLDHPNVVRIHGVRLEGKTSYQIMERVPQAKDLVDLMLEGILPIAEVLSIGEGIARGLQAIHDLGIVHRDIKPANVLVTPDGTVKITDFGLARSLESGQTLTRTRMGLGTVYYAPPEQITDARSAKPSADLYSLGATLYHLLTGKFPFADSTLEDLLGAIADEDPPPILSQRTDCPPLFSVLIHRLLAKAPEERHNCAAAVAEEILDIRRRLGDA